MPFVPFSALVRLKLGVSFEYDKPNLCNTSFEESAFFRLQGYIPMVLLNLHLFHSLGL